MNEIMNDNWFFYGIILIVSIPLLAVLLNELIYALKTNHRQLMPPIKTFKNIILPLVALLVVLTQVLDFDRGAISIKVVETIVWIIVINSLLAILNTMFFSGSEKGGVFKSKVPQLFLDIFRVVMVLFGAAIVLSTVWKLDLGGLVTALGLGSFVIGLALQDTLGNLFSGIALVYEKPFTEGDIIHVGESRGKVIEMNWRAIRLLTREGEMIVIPHLVIGQETVRNLSKPSDVCILKKEIGFGYEVPPNRVKDALMKTCLATPGILHEPEPEVKTQDYAEHKIIYEIEFAIAEFGVHEEVMDNFMSRVWYTARRFDLEMPLPQRIVHQAHEAPKKEDISIEKLRESLSQLSRMLPIEKANVDALLDGSAIQHFGKGEVIIRQGDPTGMLYVVLEGKALVSARSKEGNKLIISDLSRGDFFGEITLFTNKKSTFQVEAMEDLNVISIFPDEVLEMVEKNPRLAHFLDEMMDARQSRVKELRMES